ncbi:BrnT family toxin [candidate division WOR-3 bacterium]|nr:BrnT family toxin [candidate division WOR-3 bacterium]
MNVYNWNQEKNEKLKFERNISFEEIILAINEGNLVDVYEHPNQKDYINQKIYAVNVNNFIYLVPFVKNDNEIFLKTIIPSRKATKIILGGKHE